MIDMEPEKMPETEEEKPQSQLAMIAIVLGMICFTFSAITPWAMNVIAPAPPIVDAGEPLTLDLWANIMATGFGPASHVPTTMAHNIWTLIVIAGSIVTLCLGVMAFVRREDTRMSALAMAFGFLGVFMQYMILFAGLLVVLLLLYLVLASFGIT